jgi:hypothetical protein
MAQTYLFEDKQKAVVIPRMKAGVFILIRSLSLFQTLHNVNKLLLWECRSSWSEARKDTSGSQPWVYKRARL